jgi:transposase-like protein
LITSSPKKLPVRDLALRVGINKNTALRLVMQIKQAWSEPRQREMLERIIEFAHTAR